MFERFTERARQVVVLAQEEARMLNHNYLGTEHVLLGLIHEGEGVAARALESLGISLEAVRQQVEEIIGQGEGPPQGHIPFTPRAKTVLELSLRDRERQLLTGKTARQHQWEAAHPDLASLAEQVQRLSGDVERLRDLLCQHGIEPKDKKA